MSHSIRPFTILHTEASMGWGGQEIRILREMIGMNERGWSTILACHPESGLFLNALKYNLDVIPVYWSYKNIFSIWRQLSQTIRDCNIELINTHSSVDAWIGGLIARSCGISVVRTRHLSTPIKGGWNAKLLYEKLADTVVCTSQEAVHIVQKHVKTEALCIATGVNREKLDRAFKEQQAARIELGLKEGDIAVATACVLRSWKGLEEFIEAASAFQNQRNVHFFIFGAGSGLAHYQKWLQTHYPQANVRFMGHREDIEKWISSCDIFCLLSTANEGISQATLQAAYLKKPLITTPTGGLIEVCLHGQTGQVVACKKTEEVVSALNYLIHNPQICSSMGEKGHELVSKRFTFSQTLDQMEAVFSKTRFSHKA